jgi:hypothetical protein
MMDRGIKYDLLPEGMRDGMRRYIEHGIPPGSFQRAVLCNDLMEAFRRADDVNAHAMRDYAVFLASYAPGGCFGSPQHVTDWIAHRGLAGIDEAAA